MSIKINRRGPYRRNAGNACLVDGCDTEAISQGYCKRHYQRLYKNGTLETSKRGRKANPNPAPCSVEGCESVTTARGLCMKHYQNLRRDNGGKLP